MARGGIDDLVSPGWAGRIDWSRPWLAPLRQMGEPAAARVEAGASVAGVLNALVHAGPQFVAQHELPVGTAYEAFIAQTGKVPTRDNAHDFFNGLVWLHYPLAKCRLNQLQAGEIAREGIGASRGRLRDALTLFDENAGLLAAPRALTDALRLRDWTAAFITLRPAWAEARLGLFGHALIEKLLNPRKPITAHVWLVERLDDAALAASLQPERLAAKAFFPLPVLGVPGWWPDNEHADFYDDAGVFRPPRG